MVPGFVGLLISGNAAARAFPRGWKRMRPHVQPGVTWVRFKCVEPGESLGMAYDGLVLLDGRWRLFPEPWLVLQ
jgi:hypothetical protein